jgi:DNA-binding transcriptional MerR regulator
MMLAVNAAIDGNKAELIRLIKEHGLDTKEVRQRLAHRDGRKYEFGPRQARARTERVEPKPGSNGQPSVFDVTITRRTPVRELFRIIEQAERIKVLAQQELARRDPEQVEPVRREMARIEAMRQEMESLERKIREAEEAMG